MRTSTWCLLAGLLLSSPAQAACPPEGTDPTSLQLLREQKFAVPDDVRAALVAGLPACLADPDPALRDGVAYEGLSTWLRAGQVDVDPPVETLQEVKVLSNSVSAEFGGSAGGNIIATTKSGTNEFHGSLFEYVRNDKFDAPGFFAPIQEGKKRKPTLRAG